MFFWIREILGWLLVVVAIGLLKIGVDYVSNRQVVEAGVITMMALGTLRGGILLVRVSTAARIAHREIASALPAKGNKQLPSPRQGGRASG